MLAQQEEKLFTFRNQSRDISGNILQVTSMSACYKSKKVVIFMDRKGKETGADFKKVIMD